MVLEAVRTSVSRQFPALTPVLYPGELMTAVESFPSVSAMWQAHEVYATNNIPVVYPYSSVGNTFTTYYVFRTPI